MFYSLKLRLTIAFICIAGFVALLAVIGTMQNNMLAEAYREAASEQVPQLKALAEITVCLSRVMDDGMMLAYSRSEMKADPSAMQGLVHVEIREINESVENTFHWVDRFAELAEIAGEEADLEEADNIRRSMDKLVGMINGLIDVAKDLEQEYAWEQWHLKIGLVHDEMLGNIMEAVNGELEEMAEGQGEVNDMKADAIKIVLMVAVATLLLACGLGYVSIRSVTRPLDEMQAAAKKFGDGDLGHRVGGQALAEFRELADAFNGMAEKVRVAQKERELAYKRLAEASRMAGMAEVATSVLHNVGNVLNSVNLSAGRLNKRIHDAKVSDLSAVSSVLNEHSNDLADFVSNDKRGRLLPAFLTEMSRHMERLFTDMDDDVDELIRSVKHINQVVVMQQNYAKVKGIMESCEPSSLMDDAIQINAPAMSRHRVLVTKDYTSDKPIVTDRHKVLQILVNLLANAKQAVEDNADDNRLIEVRIDGADDNIVITVTDNGSGITPENLSHIFEHGFTTRADGHGFGLHNAAIAAKELGGSLEVTSDGPGTGATFRLTLPRDGGPKTPGADELKQSQAVLT